MGEFLQRSVTGLLLVTLIVFCVLAGWYTFILLISLINVLGLLEFYRLFESIAIRSFKLAGSLLSIFLLLTSAIVAAGFSDWRIILLNIPVAFIIFLIALFSKETNPFHRLAFTFMGIVYITLPSIFLTFIAFFPNDAPLYHSNIMLGYFCIVWASDSGAYAFGKLTGKHHLYKRISPGKTWEGSAGGTFSALLVAIIVSQFFHDLTVAGWVTTALIIIVFGTLGDLIKSMLKRSLNVKDSGTILPGHGGILDRFDSMLGSAPFVFIYLSFFS